LDLRTKNEAILVELLFPIRDPEKDPTSEELESLKPYPCLIQALEAIRPSILAIDPQLVDNDNSDDEVAFQLEREMDIVATVHNESSTNETEGPYSLDLEDSIRSLDSITRNVDFISLG
jgi:hypothetical protein